MSGFDLYTGAAWPSHDAYEMSGPSELSRAADVPPLRLGAVFELVPSRSGASSVCVALDASAWGGVWDVGFRHEVTSSLFAADLVTSIAGEPNDEPGAPNLQPYGVIGGGFRFSRLAQTWWEDVNAYGVGVEMMVGATLGTGKVRGIVAIRLDGSLLPGGATSTYGPDPSIGWRWIPSQASASLVVGVAVR